VKISCLVLAGGKSTRLGRDKIAELLGGKTLLERVLETLETFRSEIIIVTSGNSNLPSLTGYPGVKIVSDIYPGKGSLGGIYSGIKASNSHHNLVVAADMPFLNKDLLRYMVEIARGFDLVAFDEEDRPELLHAVYSKNCLAPMETLIRQNSLRIIGILPFIKVRYLSSQEVDRFDPQHLSFFNINTEEDLKKGIELARYQP
jgi:molybdenum cofactor guanylyltransferase